MTKIKNKKNGFTLLELLVVIAILAILSATLILILNPAESMRKSRDAQRISDLSTLKTAIGLYLTTVSSPDLDAAVGGCLGSGVVDAQIFYSAEIAAAVCTADVDEGNNVVAASTFAANFCTYGGASGASLVDGTGWLPVALSNIPGGSPVSNMPLDPINTVTNAVAPASTDLVYRYACQNDGGGTAPSLVFEINAQLESDAFTSTDDRRAKDGGDNDNYYEVGNSLQIIGTGTNF